MKKTKILRKKAKLDIGSLQSVAMIIVVVALVAAFGMQIMGDIRDDMGSDACSGRSDTYTSYNETSKVCYNSTGSTIEVGVASFNATGEGISAVGKISDKLGTIVIVVIAAIIIGLLIAYFGTKQKR